MPFDGTLGYLVGKLDVLRVECLPCGRYGRYDVARLVAELGPGCRLTDWLHDLTVIVRKGGRALQRERAMQSCRI